MITILQVHAALLEWADGYYQPTSGKSLLSTGFPRVKGYFPGHVGDGRSVSYGNVAIT
jgi:hypothetical protein